MNNIKKLAVVITVLICFTFSQTAFAMNIEVGDMGDATFELTGEMKDVAALQENANIAFNQFLDAFVELYGPIEEGLRTPASYPDEYAGSYIDDNGKLVVFLTPGADQNIFINYIDHQYQDVLLFKEAKYSINQLTQLYKDAIEVLDKDYTVLSAGINEIDNTAFIRVPEEQQKEIAQKFKSIYDLNNSPIIIEVGEFIETTASVKGGQKMVVPGGTGTLGFTGKYLGQYAFVTCGHGTSVGDTVTMNGSPIGKIVISRYMNNQVGDYSVATLTSGNTALNQIPAGTIVTSYDSKAVGTIVYGYGINGGNKQAKILANNVSSNTNGGVRVTGLTEVSLLSGSVVQGDSGGPWYVPYAGNYAAVGITCSVSTSGTKAYYTPMGNTTAAFNVLTYAELK